MVFSLASVTGVISNPVYGNIEFGGGNQTIGSIGYAFEKSAFSMESFVDGGAVFSHNKSRAGTISIQMSQVSAKYRELVRFAKWCFANPSLAESTCVVRDATGLMQFSATSVFPVDEPNESVSDSPSNITVELIAGKIVTDKGGI